MYALYFSESIFTKGFLHSRKTRRFANFLTQMWQLTKDHICCYTFFWYNDAFFHQKCWQITFLTVFLNKISNYFTFMPCFSKLPAQNQVYLLYFLFFCGKNMWKICVLFYISISMVLIECWVKTHLQIDMNNDMKFFQSLEAS